MAVAAILMSSYFASCSSNDSEELQILPNEEPTSYEVSLSLSGEYVETSEEPLARADEETPKKYYGVNVYCMKTDGTESDYTYYACGVFDNTADMKITLLGGYKYKFECSSVKEGVDKFYTTSSNIYDPFYTYNEYGYYGISSSEINKFTVSSSSVLGGLTSNKHYYSSNNRKVSCKNWDRYYGELTDYVPTNGGIATIPMLRTVFGIKMIISGVPDGTLSWYCRYYTTDFFDLTFAQKSHTGSEILEISDIFTFADVYDCWKANSYSKDFTINFTWTRANGYKQTFSEDITVKRNVMTVMNVNLTGGSDEVGIGVEEESTEMTNEEVNVNYDGGNMNDTNVEPDEE